MTRDEILAAVRDAMTARTAADDRLDELVRAAEATDTTWHEIGQALSLDGRQSFDAMEAWQWLGSFDSIGPEPPGGWLEPASPAAPPG